MVSVSYRVYRVKVGLKHTHAPVTLCGTYTNRTHNKRSGSIKIKEMYAEVYIHTVYTVKIAYFKHKQPMKLNHATGHSCTVLAAL